MGAMRTDADSDLALLCCAASDIPFGVAALLGRFLPDLGRPARAASFCLCVGRHRFHPMFSSERTRGFLAATRYLSRAVRIGQGTMIRAAPVPTGPDPYRPHP